MHVGEGLMDTRRLERLVIIILTILVLCLLGVVALDRLQSLNDRREMSALLTALLEDNGIRADDLTLPETPAMPTTCHSGMSTSRFLRLFLRAPRTSIATGLTLSMGGSPCP